MWLPLFGWYMWKEGLIPIDRSAGMAALARMTARARAALAAGRQIVIFPEGTRRLPGAEPTYKPGVLYLYGKADVPCVPMALNSGLYWPRRSLLRLPGTIVVEILDPIAPGLDATTFARQLEDTIEGATARLIREASDTRSGIGRDVLSFVRRCGLEFRRSRMPAEPLGEQMQFALAIAERLQRPHRLDDIVAIGDPICRDPAARDAGFRQASAGRHIAHGCDRRCSRAPAPAAAFCPRARSGGMVST